MFSLTRRGGSARAVRRALVTGTLAVATALVVSACSGTAAASDDSTSGAKSGGLKVGLIMLQGDTYFQGIQTGLEAAVKADGGTVTTGLSNNDPATEAQVAQNMIQAKVDAILMQPAGDAASLATMKSITDAGITLICYGNCLGNSTDPAVVKGVIQTDNTALGTGTGNVAVKYFQDKDAGKTVKIAILNCDIASACKLRKAGFKKALSDAGVKVTYVTDQEGYLADKATAVATDILTAHPDVDAIWASNDGGTVGATLGVKQAGKSIPVFGTDISTQIAGFLVDSDNILQVSTGQDPVKTAQGAYEMAKTAHSRGTNSPFSVQLPGVVYDRSAPDNINKFIADNK